GFEADLVTVDGGRPNVREDTRSGQGAHRCRSGGARLARYGHVERGHVTFGDDLGVDDVDVDHLDLAFWRGDAARVIVWPVRRGAAADGEQRAEDEANEVGVPVERAGATGATGG